MTSIYHSNNLCLVTLPSPSPSADSDKLSSKLDALEKVNELCDFHEKFKSNKNDPKNILNNLCTGLETFLGFNSDSKGYDGQGIVYSDLDRLCDAVMGFLKGVLEAVHENDNLSLYKNTLNEAVTKLNENLNKGKKGLQAVIGPVKQGIAAWLAEVERRNKIVLTPLNDLQALINGHLSADMNDVYITEQLENWRSLSGLYIQEVNKAERALDGIDNIVRPKVFSEIQIIRHVVENFWTSVNDRDLLSSVTELDIKFTQQRKSIKLHISLQISELQKSLNEKFDNVDAHIESMKKAKDSNISLITRAVKSADQLAEKLLDDRDPDGFKVRYQEKISNMFNVIKREMDGFVGKEGKTVFLQHFTTISKHVNGELEAGVLADLNALRDQIKKLDDNKVTEEALADLAVAKEELDTGTIDPITETSSLLKVMYDASKATLDKADRVFPDFQTAIYGETRTSKNPKPDSIAGLINELTGAIGANEHGTGDDEAKLHKAITVFENVAIERIKDAADKAIEEALKKFQMDKMLPTKIDVPEMMKVFESSKTELKQAVDGIQQEIADLKKIPDAVNSSKENADQRMEHLKSRIQSIKSRIQAINIPIGGATKALNAAFSQLDAHLKNARQTADERLQALILDLQSRVNQAFDDLETHVQKMFAEHKKAELKVIRKSVSDQIMKVERIFDADMHLGVKGMMSKLRGQFPQLTNLPTNMHIYAGKVKTFYDRFLAALNDQSDLTDHSPLLTPLAQALSSLLSTMHEQNHFSSTVSRKLADLQSALNALTPANFAEASPLLNVIKAGVRAFHAELAKQYVSRYSGEPVGEMVKEDKITTYGTKLSKVFLTSLTTLCDDLNPLKKYSVTTWKQDRINKDTSIGYFLARRGYEVNVEKDKQTGELQDKPGMLGFHIFKSLDKSRGSDNEHLQKCKEEENESDEKARTAATKSQFGVVGILNCLFRHLHQYYTACHLRHIERPKSPSNVYQMLVWLTGLPHNRVFSKVSVSDIGDLFEKPDKETHDETGDISFVSDDADTLPAHPQAIAASTLTSTIHKVCVAAEDVLTSILGHGHADGIYAVDFNTNPDGFSYPTAPGACFDMLCDVLNRLYQQLYFLYGQCSNEEPSVSWRDCWYGNLVGGSDWKCNTMQCPNQKGNQIHKQMCSQKCDQTAQCGLKSPLQSFLEDGLPGFLPHSFTKPGCKLECTYSNHRGIPCRTPMGFADISVTASHRQTGAYLKEVLEDFCGKDTSPLTKLCAQLTCLLQKPPQTLGDIFAFYYGYITDYTGGFYGVKESQTHTQQAFRNAANDAYFCKPYTALDPRILLDNTSHINAHSKGDLISITGCTSETVVPCGLYVKSLTQEISKYYSSEHKANHLSWIVYITETFCNLLQKLYDDCCKKCGPAGSKCHVKSCDEKCDIKYSDEEEKRKALKDKSHKDACKSIITCSDTYPTLYKYGFTFGNIMGLNSSGPNIKSKRTCKDFCEALKKMLAEGSVLITLRGQIDEFLWAIRTPFSYLVLALWSLSLFYLICVMVGRLDVLHIRSHLRIPSSHKITAQSLLAAAQVGRLAKISYLQP